MICRDVRPHELLECLTVIPGQIGSEIVGGERAVLLWAELSKSKAFVTAAVEASPPIAGHSIVAFGASVFVTREFAQQEIYNPQPYLNARVLDLIARGDSPVLTEAGIAAGNRKAGLDLVNFSGLRDSVLSPEQFSEVSQLMAYHFIRYHAGYRMNQILYEVPTGAVRTLLESTGGVWRMVRDFGDCARALFIMNRETSVSLYGSVAAPVFHYSEPILKLRPADRELLLAALDNSTDQELAYQLNLSLAAVKKRWVAIFERVADTHPSLLEPLELKQRSSRTGAASARGPQKRHLLLAYLRAHMEELRPW